MHDLLPALTPLAWVLVVLGAALVGISKSALPGSATIAVALFAMALPAKQSTVALLLLLMVGDWTAMWMYRRDPDWRTLVRLIPGVLVGLALGAAFLAVAGGGAVRRAIGLILIALVIVTLWRRHRATRDAARARAASASADGSSAAASASAPPERAEAPLPVRLAYGTLGGFTTMVANAGGPVMSLYFFAMRMPVLTFLGTSAWFFAIVNILKLPFSLSLGLLSWDLVRMDLLLVPVVIATAFAGRLVAERMPQRVFENAVLSLTVLSALALVV